MLVIRLSRTGKRHQPYYRIIVSDKRKSPTAKFIEIIGNFDPHSKKLTIDKEKLELYMKNGAQPSNTLAKLLKAEKISMPKWVKITEKKKAKKVKKGSEEKPVGNPSTTAQDVAEAPEEAKPTGNPSKPAETPENSKTDEDVQGVKEDKTEVAEESKKEKGSPSTGAQDVADAPEEDKKKEAPAGVEPEEKE